MSKKLKHVWHPVMLDSGEHWCIVCFAQNSELADTCPGHRLAAHLHREQAKHNLLAYGVDAWAIRDYRDDVIATTIVHRGDKVAP